MSLFVLDSDDDFQQPSANQLIATALNRQTNQPAKRQRTATKPRGPKPKIVKLKLYLLPDGSDLPKLKKKDPQIAVHQSHGFGK